MQVCVVSYGCRGAPGSRRIFFRFSISPFYQLVKSDMEQFTEQKKALDQKRSEPRPVYEKKVFNNVPSGRYVSSSVGSNAFKPFKQPDENNQTPAPAPASVQAPKPSPAPNNNSADTAKKNKKFFGLF